jgi:hypothetical protein
LRYGKKEIKSISVMERFLKVVTVLLPITELPNPTIFIVSVPVTHIRQFLKQLLEDLSVWRLPKV